MEARRDLEIEQLNADKRMLQHELELKAQLYEKEVSLMKDHVAGLKEERQVALQRITSLEGNMEPLQRDAGRVPELEDKLARATAEVDELHEAMRELEEEMTQQREAAIAALTRAFEAEREELQAQLARLALQLKSEDTLQEDNAELQRKVSEQQDTIYQLIREDECKESVLDMLRDGETGAKDKHTRALRTNTCHRR